MISYDEIIDGIVWTVVLNERGEVIARYRREEEKQAA